LFDVVVVETASLEEEDGVEMVLRILQFQDRTHKDDAWENILEGPP